MPEHVVGNRVTKLFSDTSGEGVGLELAKHGLFLFGEVLVGGGNC